MEFVIVLPLYLALLGMVFFYGDMSLAAVKLAASGDRTLAVSHGMSDDSIGGTWNVDSALPLVKEAMSISSNREDVATQYFAGGRNVEANASVLSEVSRGVVAEPGFKGSWSWLVGSKATDEYALLPVTRSFVLAWKAFADSFRMSGGSWEKDREYEEDSALARLFPGASSSGYSFGRVPIVSKDLVGDGYTRRYAYYTLMRSVRGRRSYRNWDSGALLSDSGKAWEKFVSGEEYFFDKDGKRDFSHLGGEDVRGSDAPEDPGKIKAYERYRQFMKWSE